MKAEAFYQRFADLMNQSPVESYRLMSAFHDEIAAAYLAVLRAITPQQAVHVLAEGRTAMQVVRHILEWDRYMLIGFGEIMAGVTWPGMWARKRYVHPDGTDDGYETLDGFNALVKGRYPDTDWSLVQAEAIRVTTMLHRLLTQSGLITPELLDGTRAFNNFKTPTGLTINRPLPCGWYLWMVVLEHPAVEHMEDLAVENLR